MDWLTRLLARSMRSAEPLSGGTDSTVDRRFTHLAAAAAMPLERPVRLFRRLR